MAAERSQTSVDCVAGGIDLGSGFTKGATSGSDSKATDTRNDQTGLDTTPTCFLFLNGELLWGDEAVNARALCPHGFIAGEDIKRNLASPSWRFRAPDGKEWSATELYAVGADRMATLIAKVANGRRVVIQPTLPENFTDGARCAVIDAYKQAGIDAFDPVSEPVAAAYYLASLGEFQLAIVIDVGHGTTDVSVVRLEGKRLRVIAHAGIPELGGRDFRMLIEEAFLKNLPARPDRADASAMPFFQELRSSAERAKVTLSSVGEATVVATPLGAKPARLSVTRGEFETLAEPLARRIVDLAKKVVGESQMQPKDLTWLLVGGGSRVPLIAKSLHAHLGIVARVHQEASNAIARGAALLAADRLHETGRAPIDPEGRPAVGPGIDLVTAAPHTLGVLAQGGLSAPLRLAPLIRRNTPIEPGGTTATDYFAPLHSMQPRVLFKIAQGEPGALEAECHVIGEVVLPLDPPGDPFTTRLKVTFKYDRSGIVHMEAVDMRSNKTVTCQVRAPGTPAAAA